VHGIVAFLEDVERIQLRELYQLTSSSIGASVSNLSAIRERLAEQVARPRSAAARPPAAEGPPAESVSPAGDRRQRAEALVADEEALRCEARKLGQAGRRPRTRPERAVPPRGAQERTDRKESLPFFLSPVRPPTNAGSSDRTVFPRRDLWVRDRR